MEKPVKLPKPMPNNLAHVLTSMRNYVFKQNALFNELTSDAQQVDSDHDFGKNIISRLIPKRQVFVYDFSQNQVSGAVKEAGGY
jgi:glucose-1-phosphate adenylyltransferase